MKKVWFRFKECSLNAEFLGVRYVRSDQIVSFGPRTVPENTNKVANITEIETKTSEFFVHASVEVISECLRLIEEDDFSSTRTCVVTGGNFSFV